MTEHDIQTRNDAALGSVLRLHQVVIHAKARVEETAQEMHQIANWLSSGRYDVSLNAHSWLNDSVLTQITKDVERAQQEFSEACTKAESLGVAIPDSLKA